MSMLYSIEPAHAVIPNPSRLTSLPILILNVHTQCNCRCVMCDIWSRKDGRAMSLADLTPHRESILSLGVKQIVLTGGEPLLNREFQQIADFCRSVDARVTLLTSGLLLNAKSAAIAASVDEIIVSVDGPPNVHNSIRRVPMGFQKMSDGVEAVHQHNQGLPISCRVTVQKLNHEHLCDTVDAARSIGMKSISFLPADLTSSAFNRENPWDHARKTVVGLTSEEVCRLELEIEKLISCYTSSIRSKFIVEDASKLRRIAARFREHLENTPPTAPLCNAPWHSAVIEVNGDLRPCFFHTPIANISAQPLAAAINSSRAALFRRGLDVATNPTCQRCVCSLNYRDSSA